MISPAQDRLNVTLVAPCFHVWGKTGSTLGGDHTDGEKNTQKVFSAFALLNMSV